MESKDFVTGETVVLPMAGPANRQGRICADNALMDFCRDRLGAHQGAASARCNPLAPDRPLSERPRPSFRGVQGTAVCGAFGVVAATTGASEKTLKRLNIPYEAVKLHPGALPRLKRADPIRQEMTSKPCIVRVALAASPLSFCS